MSGFPFTIAATDGAARTGVLDTPRGKIRTPAFMPVGTQATVKTMYPEQVRALGSDIVLGNTYHLMLRPGAERVARLGGLHEFMRWPHPILTDSGGFQVMSLASLRKIDADGVSFRSHIDGSEHRLTPERSIEIQRLLDSDIVMQLDECLKLPAEPAEVERAMRLSLAWAERSKVGVRRARKGKRSSASCRAAMCRRCGRVRRGARRDWLRRLCRGGDSARTLVHGRRTNVAVGEPNSRRLHRQALDPKTATALSDDESDLAAAFVVRRQLTASLLVPAEAGVSRSVSGGVESAGSIDFASKGREDGPGKSSIRRPRWLRFRWRLAGDWFDVCRCRVPCGCTFAQAPDEGQCDGILAWHVRNGSYGDDLDGLKVVGVGSFEGNLWTG